LEEAEALLPLRAGQPALELPEAVLAVQRGLGAGGVDLSLAVFAVQRQQALHDPHGHLAAVRDDAVGPGRGVGADARAAGAVVAAAFLEAAAAPVGAENLSELAG